MDDEKLLESFPVLTGGDIKRINALFNPYLFYTRTSNGGRDCECTACGEAFSVDGSPRIQTPEWREFMGAKHNHVVNCPRCRRSVTLKNRGTCKSGASLEEWRRVVLLHTRDGEVYAQAAYMRKRYAPGCWRPEVEAMPKAMYMFRPGEAAGWRWRHDYTFLGITPRGKPVQEGWERMKNICEPWPSNGYSGYGGYFWNGYHVIGQERLADSFLRYCAEAFPKWSKVPPGDGQLHDGYLRLLAAAAARPQIEMLLKMGLTRIVDSMVLGKKKLTREIRWEEKDPRRAFGLTGPELRSFCAVNGSAEELRWYGRLKKAGVRTDFQELEEVDSHIPNGLSDRFFRTCAIGCGVKPAKALAYIREKGGKNYVTRDTVILWTDYVSAAKYCGFDLTGPLALMPRRLKDAHDGAVETELRLRHENEVMDDSPYQRRYQKLMERYGFSDGEFFIRAPSSSREIIQEGRILRHCVGRYAGAHAKGTTTILFMRRTKAPFLPAWTIEVQGDRVVQVQGRSDDSRYLPRDGAARFLKRWKAWVQAGSRRDKAGEPVEKGAMTA